MRYQVKLDDTSEHKNIKTVLVRPENISSGSPKSVLASLSAFKSLLGLQYSTGSALDRATMASLTKLHELQDFKYRGRIEADALQDMSCVSHGLKKLLLSVKGSVGNEALKHISNCKALVELSLSDFKSSDAGLAGLVDSTPLLSRMTCYDMPCGHRTLSVLAKHGRMCELQLVGCSGDLDCIDDLVTNCPMEKITLSEHKGFFDLGSIHPSSSMEHLFLENQPFDPEEVASLQHWHNLNELCLYSYDGGLIGFLLAAAASLRHITKIVLCAWFGHPPAEEQVAAMQSALAPCFVIREGSHAVIFQRQIQQNGQRQPPNAQASDAQAIDTSGTVLENVVHAEPAATIDDEVAQQAVNIQWVEDVQSRIGASGSSQQATQGEEDSASNSCTKGQEKQQADLRDNETGSEQVCLLQFGCNDTQGFRKSLLEGRHMQACRMALESSGCSCELPGGALMFVRPDQCLEVRRALEGMQLYAYHVIIATTFESDLQDALSCMPYRKRPREKVKHRRELLIQLSRRETEHQEPDEDEFSSQETKDNEASYELCRKRTFLCYAPKLKEPDDVVQSTTEVVSHAINPRRFA